MKVQTQLTLSGEEAAEYMEYRTELAKYGFTSFEALKKEQNRLKKLKEYVILVQNIQKAIHLRIKHDNAYIIGGGQYHSVEQILEGFKKAFLNSLNAYVNGKSLSEQLQLELLKLTDDEASKEVLRKIVNEIIEEHESPYKKEMELNKESIFNKIWNKFTFKFLNA